VMLSAAAHRSRAAHPAVPRPLIETDPNQRS